jgi:(1->4)-alpha-D-glucan 1-alpha-D-glucosylmutase
LYRGTEVWDLSLADPDNRRLVDFSTRQKIFDEVKNEIKLPNLLKRYSDGRLKMFITWKALQFRRTNSDLFTEGEYIPLRVTGAQSNHVIAFARYLHERWLIVAVPRLFASLSRAGSAPTGEKIWRDTQIELPSGIPARGTNVFTNEEVSTRMASDLFATLPFAVVDCQSSVPRRTILATLK